MKKVQMVTVLVAGVLAAGKCWAGMHEHPPTAFTFSQGESYPGIFLEYSPPGGYSIRFYGDRSISVENVSDGEKFAAFGKNAFGKHLEIENGDTLRVPDSSDLSAGDGGIVVLVESPVSIRHRFLPPTGELESGAFIRKGAYATLLHLRKGAGMLISMDMSYVAQNLAAGKADPKGSFFLVQNTDGRLTVNPVSFREWSEAAG